MPGSVYNRLFEIAADQHGYLTTAQARAEGIRPGTLTAMARRGTIERVSHGVYRLVQFPFREGAAYMEASLWPVGVRGVISHESALALYEISDVNPSKIHVTVPGVFRVRRRTPDHLVIHHADLRDDEIDRVDSVAVTTAERTIRDCSAAQLGPEIVRQAIGDAQRNGLLTARAADALRSRLLSY
ncbi:MAG TPA: type IV toxin-antitoxin system AbiEi family antitoxin domain-containing protein [Longimicrobium sp.]|jgi:predicted transcriptional regulator of viral defense system